MPYIIHPLALIRSPLKSLKSSFSIADLKKLYHNKDVQEALYLASPILYRSLKKALDENNFEDNGKLINSLLKYAVRMHTRCTPFGLFAGCGVVDFSKSNSYIIEKHHRKSRLDMEFISNLVYELNRIEDVINNLNLFPNSSIYELNGNLRYIEYNINGSQKEYQISSIEQNPILRKILYGASKGRKKEELINLIKKADPAISFEEASNFILSLIDEQILVTEIDPKMTGTELLSGILEKIKNVLTIVKNEKLNAIYYSLKRVESALKELDLTLKDNSLDTYQSIIDEINTIEVLFDSAKLFQVDSFRDYKKNDFPSCSLTLKENDSNLAHGISIINMLSARKRETAIDQFKENFYARYEHQEVPLTAVLDSESGIGYGRNSNFVENKTLKNKIIWDKWTSFLFEKYLYARDHKNKIIYIDKNELTDFEESWEGYPASMSLNYRHVGRKDSRDIIFIKNIAGSSAINMIGRFAYGEKKINDLINEIENTERKFYGPDKLLAEIVHLPESRIGNVLLRPSFREYEIPYLSLSSVSSSKQLDISDLYLSIRDNQLFLRSKRLNKQVIPRLGNAHNFTYGDLPIYHFLADMQTLGKSAYISFDWMDLQKMFTYFPRVQVGEHIILSPETWRLKNKELNIVIKESNDEQIISVISNWRKKHQIPEKVIIIEGDNELLIDLTNVLSIKTMLLYVKNKPNFIISEFIFDPENPLLRNNKNEIYTNEIIRSLHRTGTVPSKELSPLVNFKKNIKRSFILGSEWIYYKIYCGDDTADSLLISRFKPMIESFIKKGYINKWFFVRYNDPHKHLRIRFSVTNQTHIADVISTIRKILQSFQDSNNIWKIQTETYIRELERYGMRSIDDVEQIFFEDSMLWLNIYNSLNDVSDSAIILSVLNINQILNDFQLSSNEKFNLMENIKMAFYSEFEIDKKKKLNIDKLYREKKGIIFKILAERTEQTEMLKIFRNHQVKYGKKHYHNIITLRDKGELEIPLNSIIASLIHMSMNRIFPKDQRLNELFIYDFVSRYYKTKLFLEK